MVVEVECDARGDADIKWVGEILSGDVKSHERMDAPTHPEA